MDLFEKALEQSIQSEAPLADRMRPRTLEEFVGQQHILAPGRLLRRAIQADQLSSLIFYGPPGTGKTTIARLAAKMLASIGILKKGQLIEVTRKVSAATLQCRTTHAPLWPRCTHAHTPR